MSKYYHVSVGLRGCYMPDNSYAIRVNSRRDLKDAIESEARDIRDAGYIGANKRAVAWLAATCWKEAKKPVPAYLPYCLPYRDKSQSDYPYGIFVSVASRSEWLEYQAQNEDANA